MKREFHRIRALKWGYGYVRRKVPIIIGTLCLSAVINYLYTFEPVITGNIIDSLTAQGQYLGDHIIKLITVLFFILVLNLLYRRISVSVETSTTKLVESGFYRQYQFNHQYDNEESKRRMQNILCEDIPYFIGLYTKVFPTIVVDIITYVVISYRLLKLDVFVFLVAFVISIIPIAFSLFTARISERIQRLDRKQQDIYFGCIRNLIYGKEELVVNSDKDFASKKLGGVLDAKNRIIVDSTRINNRFSIIMFFINSSLLVSTFYIFNMLILGGKITVGDIISAFLLTEQLKSTISQLCGRYSDSLISLVSVERIRSELLETRTTKPFLLQSGKNMPYIEVKDFHVSFPGNSFMMESLNFIIDRPGLYVLAGKNGTGKTTFFNCLAGLPPENAKVEGTIILDEACGLSYLFQTPFRYSFSILEYLMCPQDGMDGSAIWAALETVGLKKKVLDLEKGIDSIIGIDTDFSEGELKRLCLARLLLSQANVYLIDEVDANCDMEFLSKLKDILNEKSRSSIVLLISHSRLFLDEDVNMICF